MKDILNILDHLDNKKQMRTQRQKIEDLRQIRRLSLSEWEKNIIDRVLKTDKITDLQEEFVNEIIQNRINQTQG